MRIMHVGDPHLSVKNPDQRIDDFYKISMDKLAQIARISVEMEVDINVFVGDMCHIKAQQDNPPYFLNAVQKRLAPIKGKKNFLIFGSHDVLFGKVESLESMPVYNFIVSGLFKPLVREEFPLGKGNLVLHGFNFDVPESQLLATPLNNNDFNIAVTHCLLLGFDFPAYFLYMKGKDHMYRSDEIAKSNFDLFMMGHDHREFHFQQKNAIGRDQHFVSAGSTLRIAASEDSRNRMPKVIIIDIDEEYNVKFTDIPLKTLPFDQVFSSVGKVQKEIQQDVSDIISMINMDVQPMDIRSKWEMLPADLKEFTRPYLQAQFLL